MGNATTKASARARRGGVVRVDARTDQMLTTLSKEIGEARNKIVAKSLELLRRQRILDSVCEGYRQLRSDPSAWAAEKAEREVWEASDLDGLEDE